MRPKSKYLGRGMLGNVFLVRRRQSGPDGTLMAMKFDDIHLYYYLEYIAGGELHRYMEANGPFNTETTRFYVVEIVSAIAYLHSQEIIYRDLKPENIMLDLSGHLRIIDFGFAKRVTQSTWTFCGTPNYLAPEILKKRAYKNTVDWWSLGILTYEMLTGSTPFNGSSLEEISIQILCGVICYPPNMDVKVKDFIQRLLVREPHRRLGSTNYGSSEVKRHPFIRNSFWYNKFPNKSKPPIIPAELLDGRQLELESGEALRRYQAEHPGKISWIDGFEWNGLQFRSRVQDSNEERQSPLSEMNDPFEGF
ncbi:hypothetical protein ACOME3_000385 [Neoechinorhynchus agilis]